MSSGPQSDEAHLNEGQNRSLRALLLRGGLAMGVAAGFERGLNFLANLLAARVAGPELFGAYSLVLATASTMATYAGAGIGTTANRFAGAYPDGTPEHRGLLRALLAVSVSSAAVAALLLFVGAEPFARLFLRNDGLATLLRLAALSSGVMILLECCRGLLIGQQRFAALLVMSLVAGLGLLIFLPAAARLSPAAMIVTQGLVGLAAIGVLGVFARRLGVVSRSPAAVDVSPSPASTAGPGVSDVLRFGLVQLGAVIGLNIAGWWITSLVARADVTLVQVGIYAVSNQFRQLINIIPDLLARLCYPLLTAETGRPYGGPARVIQVNTFVIAALAVSTSSVVLCVLPFALAHLYGRSYAAAELPSGLLIATAVIHMSGTPIMNRLNIIDLRAVGLMNAAWTVVIIALGWVLVPRYGATGGAVLFLIVHVLSAVVAMPMLGRREAVPRGLIRMIAVVVLGTVTIAVLTYFRFQLPSRSLMLTLLLFGAHMAILAGLILVMRGEDMRLGGLGPKSLVALLRAR